MAEAFKACRTASQSISVASNGGRGSQEAADACSPRRRAIRRRHSAVDEGRGGRVVARHIYQMSAPLFTADRYSTSTDDDQEICDAELSKITRQTPAQATTISIPPTGPVSTPSTLDYSSQGDHDTK